MSELLNRKTEMITLDSEKPAIRTNQYLTFVLSGETFALEIPAIKEILQFGELTVVPFMPSFIRGVINLRGKVVPVMDLNSRFGRGSTRIARRTSIVIVKLDDDVDSDAPFIGIMVDAVNEVVEIAETELEATPEFGGSLRVDFISGMAKHQGRFIVVLNLPRVLSIDEMMTLGRMLVDELEGNKLLELEHGSAS